MRIMVSKQKSRIKFASEMILKWAAFDAEGASLIAIMITHRLDKVRFFFVESNRLIQA